MKINQFFNQFNLICLYVFFTLLFPTLIFNKILLVFIAFFFFRAINSYIFLSFSPIYVFLIFAYGFFISFFNNVDKNLSIQFFLTTISLLIIYPILKYKIDFDKIVKLSGLFLAFYSFISFFIVVVYLDSPISGEFYNFFREYSSGSYGLREFTDEGLLSFHAGTAPFLFLSLVLYFESFAMKKTLFTFIAILLHIYIIFISGSRGTFFTTLLALLFIIFFNSSIKVKVGLVLLVIPIIFYFISFLLQNTEIFSSNEVSNNVKFGHLESFIESSNFSNLIIGNGLGAIYFTKGSGMYKAHTEITPIDMIRYLGIILTSLLYLVIIFPTKRIRSYLGDNLLYIIIFLIYIFNSITNPIMFNSYGLLVVLWYWNKILKKEQNLMPKN
jgi:hypothetical protein